MSIEKRAQRIRQTPKHLEKMLFVNHKEEQGLQRRLETITTDSRVKGRLLDRERIKVRNECRFISRLNYQSIAPLLDRLPTLIHGEMTKHGYTVESVNDYLLREYRRNSRVIPSILSSINKEHDREQEEAAAAAAENKNKNENEATKTVAATTRKQSVSMATSGLSLNDRRRKSVVIKQTPQLSIPSSHNSSNNSDPLQRKKFYVADHDNNATTTENESDDGFNPKRISTLVKEIAKIRNDMSANKKIDLMRSRVTFPELLRNVQEKDKQGSESDTFTDGTCVLLRRKMQKIRKNSVADPDLEVCTLLGQGQGHGAAAAGNNVQSSNVPKKRHSIAPSAFQSKVPRLPSVATKTNKSPTTMNSIARQSILDNDEKELKRQLDEQERQEKNFKVAMESRKYNKIQRRIDDFLQKTPAKRPAIPIIYETEIG